MSAYGRMGVWAYGRMGVWAYGRIGVWAYGRMGVWAYGRMGVWAYGRMGVWAYGRIGVSAYRRIGVSAFGVRRSAFGVRRFGASGRRPGRDRVPAIRGYRSRGPVITTEDKNTSRSWHILAARGDAALPKLDAPSASAIGYRLLVLREAPDI
jgi:hypothetical protein